MRITAPYKLVSAQNHARRTTIRVGGVPDRSGHVHPDRRAVRRSRHRPRRSSRRGWPSRRGATLLRGGAYKPRTSPYAFQGLGVDGLRILADVRDEVGLPVVTEVMDSADVDTVCTYADMLQVGNPQHAELRLLQAVGSAGKPVMLKRGLTATYEEWLMAAEYIAQRGNLDIVLCERGVRSFEPAIRNMLDVSAVATSSGSPSWVRWWPPSSSNALLLGSPSWPVRWCWAPVRFVKTIGDAVMFVSPDPAALLHVVLELLALAGGRELPRLRAGIATAGRSATTVTGTAVRSIWPAASPTWRGRIRW